MSHCRDFNLTQNPTDSINLTIRKQRLAMCLVTTQNLRYYRKNRNRVVSQYLYILGVLKKERIEEPTYYVMRD